MVTATAMASFAEIFTGPAPKYARLRVCRQALKVKDRKVKSLGRLLDGALRVRLDVVAGTWRSAPVRKCVREPVEIEVGHHRGREQCQRLADDQARGSRRSRRIALTTMSGDQSGGAGHQRRRYRKHRSRPRVAQSTIDEWLSLMKSPREE
jgi:hypothetical protein